MEREVGQGGEVCSLAFWKRNLSAKESKQTKKDFRTSHLQIEKKGPGEEGGV